MVTIYNSTQKLVFTQMLTLNPVYIITTLSNKEIKYVHKLQNLYYELKDNELKLK